MKICRSAPIISHIFFADDCFLFFRATQPESTTLRSILSIYEAASGQAINLGNFGIFFSANVTADLREDISNCLQVLVPLNTSKYLGLPSLIGRNKKSVFAYLKDLVWSRIQL